MKIHIEIPDYVNAIIKKLIENGYEAYVVGGCVRDSILGRMPEDWDVTTSAEPEQVKALFRRTVDTGIQHGTVTVLSGKDACEVTTYRIDGKYADHRRPESVLFTHSLEEDLLRRDFTMNAMAYNEDAGLIDLYGGLDDLRRGLIRCVGNAAQRFDEDALRILRAYRFAAQIGFSIDRETREAARRQGSYLRDISAERIRTELTKLLTGRHPELLLEASADGITRVVLPEFDAMLPVPQNNPHHQYTVGVHAVEAVKVAEPDAALRWTMLLHDVGKPQCRTTDGNGVDHFAGHAEAGETIAGAILRRLKFDNDTVNTVKRLIRWHDYRWGTVDRRAVRRAAAAVGVGYFPLLLKVQRADVLAQSDYYRKEKLAALTRIEELYGEIRREKECLTLQDLAIRGDQLIGLGVPQGPMLGTMLRRLLDLVIEEPERNEYEQLKARALELLEIEEREND